jgi:hypothetical protein
MPHHFQQTCAYFTASRYMRAAERQADSIFAPTGLKPAYSYIMLTLFDQHPQSVTSLADELGYERSSISRMVKTLSGRNLVRLTSIGRTTQVDLGPDADSWLPTAEACLSHWGKTTDELFGNEKRVMVDALVANTRKLEQE